MFENSRTKKLAILGAVAVVLGLSAVAPAFAWTSSLSTTIYCKSGAGAWSVCASTTSIPAGTAVKDKATLTLTSDGGPYGTISFYIYSGTYNTDKTCAQNVGASTLYWTDPSNAYTVAGSGATNYYSSSPTSLVAGSYFFYVVYSGTGSGGYPSAAKCEPFTTAGYPFPPPSTVPQFPLGMALLLAVAIPGLLLVRSKYTGKHSSYTSV